MQFFFVLISYKTPFSATWLGLSTEHSHISLLCINVKYKYKKYTDPNACKTGEIYKASELYQCQSLGCDIAVIVRLDVTTRGNGMEGAGVTSYNCKWLYNYYEVKRLILKRTSWSLKKTS